MRADCKSIAISIVFGAFALIVDEVQIVRTAG
jgi:hypothetical protein